ncbi:MAG: methylated-DNA--[protein]-cysteine S-methyltransferase [Candidatus Lokiarchaeia archaeon]|nr:methylated-DNA--[protein]-cysteine S-methyltransferase [Candidatus Lokiarchaeia archaeon]
MKFLTFPSPFGTFTIVWKGIEPDLQLQRIFLSDSEHKSENKAFISLQGLNLGSSSHITSLGDKIQQFLEGEVVEFNLELLDFNLCTKIQEKVLRADFRSPRGWISTYKRIANYIRVQNGARVVGNLLARNPFPIIIPCHRAIKSNGELGGYQGGIDMKRKLLEMEGIEFSNSGKVITKKIFY